MAHIPVNIRVYCLAELTDSQRAANIQEMRDAVEMSIKFWREKAAIDLVWQNEDVEILDIPELSETDADRTPLDELWTEGMTWIPLYFTGARRQPMLTEAGWFKSDMSAESFAHIGAAYFATPWNGNPGYGCVVPFKRLDGRWNAVAHEIGHVLGLTHPGPEIGKNEDKGEDGLTLSEVCIAPFPDDLKDYRQEHDNNNLMAKQGGNDHGASLTNTWLTESQVQRARLTVVTRSCPFATRFDTRATAPVDAHRYGPLMSELPAELTRQIFPCR